MGKMTYCCKVKCEMVDHDLIYLKTKMKLNVVIEANIINGVWSMSPIVRCFKCDKMNILEMQLQSAHPGSKSAFTTRNQKTL